MQTKLRSSPSSSSLWLALDGLAHLHGVPFRAETSAQIHLGYQQGLTPLNVLHILQAEGFPAYQISFNKAIKQVHPCLVFSAEKDKPSTFIDTFIPADSTPTAKPVWPTDSIIICVPPHQGQNADLLAWFWTPMRRLAGLHRELMVACLFINLFSLALPLFTMSIYDKVLPTFATSTLWSLTVGVVIVLVLDFMFRMVRASLLAQAQQNIGQSQEESLLNKYLRQQGTPADTGERMESFRALAHARDEILLHILPTLADIPFVFLFILLIFVLSPVLALVPICIFIVLAIVQGGLVPTLVRLAHQRALVAKRRENLLFTLLSSVLNLKLTNSTGRAMFLWRQQASKFLSITQHGYVLQQVGQALSSSLAQLTTVGIMVCGVFQVNAGLLTVGGLIACSILAGRALSPALHLADAIGRLKRVNESLKELEKVSRLPLEKTTASAEAPEVLHHVKGQLSCKQVTCTYSGMAKAALNAIQLDIPAGQRVGIIGRNGAGKSTLAAAFSGLLTPVQGQILCDGIDISRISMAEYRNHLMYVPQTPFLPSGPLKTLIAPADAEPDEQRLQQAAELSGLQSMLSQNGMGLGMDIRENGQNLSSGQRQMIALAQAFYRSPKMLILDEPTSHFDHDLEEKVKVNLQAWLNQSQSTFILITHRLGLLSLVDRLLVMDNGSIVLDGPRDAILKQLQSKGARMSSASPSA